MRTRPLSFLRRVAVALTFLCMLQPCVHAADITWQGGGADENWSSLGNWDVTPSSGDSLIFSGALRLSNSNDLALSSNLWMRFDADGFVLNGNALTLVSGITNSVGTNQVGMNLSWASTARTFNVAAGGELVIAGTNTISAGDHTYTGGGRLRLKGTHIQLINNPATILNNIEYVIDGGTFTNGGGVRITSGTSPVASKLILTNGASMNQIITAGAMRIGDATGISGQLVIDNSILRGTTNNMFIPFASGGIGSVIQRGGTNTGLVIAMCNNTTTGGTGNYDMIGGTLETTQIKKNAAFGNGTASMSFDNSTVRALPGAATAFFTGLNTAEIKSGGLTIDANGETFTVSQIFSGTGRLTKTGSGTVTINGASTFSGGLFASGGTVTLSTSNIFGGGVTVTSGILQLANDFAIPGSLTLSGGTIRGNNLPRTVVVPVSLAGNVTFASNSDLNFTGVATLTGNRTLTINNTNTFSGSIDESGGSRSLTKAGTGNLILNGTNTYSGATTISAGTLVLGSSGSIANTTNISVATGATFNVTAVSGGFVVGSGKTLKGSGTVSGAVNIAGTISGGTTTGTLTSGAVTLNTGSTLLWEINNAASDSITAASLDVAATALTLDVTALETLTNWSPATATNWVLVHTTGGGIANFSASKFTIVDHFSSSNSIGGGAFSVTSNGTDLVLQFTPGAGDSQSRVLTTTAAGAASFTGLPNTGYTIEYTDDLGAAWAKLTTVGVNGVVTTDSNGNASFQDPTIPLPAHRFYRIVNP